jgi:diazepam-binding inhibitor (GABA receptor modulator, acyl-CoA-binding protein)
VKEEKEEEEEIPEDAMRDMFDITAQFISESKIAASDELKLQLYGYYKQATVGDCNTVKPGLLDFVGKAKWDAWNRAKGMSTVKAMQNYIAVAVKIDPSIRKKMAAALQE